MLLKLLKRKQKQRYWFLSVFISTLGASLLGGLTGKGVIRAGEGTSRTSKTFDAALTFN